MITDVTIPAALIAGIVSFLSPCVLPLVPPYLIYLTGATIEQVADDEQGAASRRAVMVSALVFVLGFSTVFVILGASASLIGSLVRAYAAQLSLVAGVLIILMGLHFLGLTRIGVLMREGRMTMPKPVEVFTNAAPACSLSSQRRILIASLGSRPVSKITLVITP